MIDTSKYATASHVAGLIGEPRATLISAVDAGLVDAVRLKCGTLCIEISSARRWAKSDRKRGRPPKADADTTLDCSGADQPNYRSVAAKLRKPKAKRASQRRSPDGQISR